MALILLTGDIKLFMDDTTKELHYGRVTGAGGVTDLGAVINTTALFSSLVPTGANAIASAATTGVGTVDVITLEANTIYVDITFNTVWHYATPGTTPPGTTEGAKYALGITTRIYTFKTVNLYVESVAGAGAYHGTCYTHA